MIELKNGELKNGELRRPVAAISFGVLLFSVLTFSGLVSALPAQAATCAQQYPDNCPARVQCQIRDNERHFIRSVNCICSGDCKLNDFVGLGVEASRYIFGITGSLALIMFAVGGFWWLTAAGVADRIEKGKKTLVAAVFGIIIIFGAWIIVNFLLAALTGQLGAGPVKILGSEWWKTP